MSNNDIIDRLEGEQDGSTRAISRNRLRPSVHDGTEPLSLPLLCSTWLPRLSGEQILPRAGYPTLGLEAELDLGD